jgi:hypothetical protein
MNTAEQETEPIKACGACGAWIAEGSKFCRLCGARQSHPLASVTESPAQSEACEYSSVSNYQTTKLSREIRYHPVSGPLVKAVSAGVPANIPGSHAKEIPKRLLLALMAIPIWVMIILLSPIDAYASAKIIGQRI